MPADIEPVEPAPAATAAEPHKLDVRIRYAIAGIALGATLFGAVVGAGASVYVANLNADTQLAVARYNFTHNQLQTAYAAFLKDAYAARQSQHALGDKIFTAARSESEIAASLKDARDAHTKMHDDLLVMRLLAPNEVLNPTQSLDTVLSLRLLTLESYSNPSTTWIDDLNTGEVEAGKFERIVQDAMIADLEKE